MSTKPKFNLADGQLSIYSLACGYIQRATPTGEKSADEFVQLEMQSSCCFDVTFLKFHPEHNYILERVRESFNTIGEARSKFKEMVKQHNFKLFVAKAC